jgi:hypothetical protein
LTTKYSIVDRKFSVPIECFHDLILDLQRLNTAASATSIEAPIPKGAARGAHRRIPTIPA